MDAKAIHERLARQFGERITGASLEVLDPWATVAPEALLYGVMKLQEKIQEDRVFRKKGDTEGSLAGASRAPESIA